MAKKTLARVSALAGNSVYREDAPAGSGFRERALLEESLFQGKDERGCDGWFLRLEVTGLYPRRVGPFSSKARAVELLEEFLGEVVMGPLCETGNTVRDKQVCVVEGMPRLAASPNSAEGTR